ncbi:phospholipase D family protein [Photobacterium sp. SDRW27]|uniref:phospholipase D family protein n=1 Tax=Photobacterium obscurum TaxID=2829490 RepID=UPI0022435C52|nr:phospholipase D family protein [Photobacterium obscurum]MCW8330244.1 phospholipase D family protein [Photobacterium obscurum]
MRKTHRSFYRVLRFINFSFIAVLIGCSQQAPINKEFSTGIPFDTNTALATYTLPYLEPYSSLSGFYPLDDGQEALLARLAMIQAAEKSIDLQYYIYRDDNTSSLMTWALYQAAERGVRIRILLDDMQSRDDATLATLSSHPNIELRLFNPFENRSFRLLGFVGDFDRLNRRMHNKAIIADGAFAITGGRNIGNEYFAANDTVDFGDFDLLLIGAAVADITVQFDVYWNSRPATPVEYLVDNIQAPTETQLAQWHQTLENYFKDSAYITTLAELPLAQNIKNQSLDFYLAEAVVVYDQPSKVYAKDTNALLLHQITAVLEQAESDFLLISPYFVPTKNGAKALADAAREGLNVTIITNSLASNDVFAVHGWYAKYRKMLLEGGVKLYEVKVDPSLKKDRSWLGSSQTSLHAKTFIIDRHTVFVGSFNFDPRSAYINTEMGVFLDTPEFVEHIYQQMDTGLIKNTYRLALNNGEIIWIDDHNAVQFDSEPNASIWAKIGAWLSGILPIESQL